MQNNFLQRRDISKARVSILDALVNLENVIENTKDSENTIYLNRLLDTEEMLLKVIDEIDKCESGLS